ncbi:DUF881 domain-containing protein [Hathewaya limosa]|uniref:Uncharacterized protein YlxW (UPF0749 family) n=1 Tax=Hathewaya limosa TaxID=1536 RepID=A0ABU0JUU5_HATLI|nr:DUF881 domain-containing protein [Hathewaya limosa]MDQ0480874.1 uncharacterized protein YlxW (UPF0749 family) [Hathewaya limosa]
MKKNEATVFVFIASVIIGILISMNLSFGEKNKVFLNIEQFNDAYNKRNKMYKEISGLKEEISKIEKKLNKYNLESNDITAVNKEIEKEIQKNKEYFGLGAVEGEGIRITVNDAKESDFNEYYMILNLVHDTDIWFLLNELRVAGAEAIAINGNRVVGDTYSYCWGTYIKIGGVNTVAPFYIDVIGNQVALKDYLSKESNHVKNLQFRKIRVNIEEDKNIKIPAYEGKVKFDYAKEKK